MPSPKQVVADLAAAPKPAPMINADADGAAGQPDDSIRSRRAAPSEWTFKPLAKDCPVTALGQRQGRNFFLDYGGQLVDIGPEFRKGEVMQLFGTKIGWLVAQYPEWKYPRSKDEAPFIDGFHQKEAQQALVFACAQRGLFNPTGKIRGRGAHDGPAGEIILHCGDRLLIGGRRNPSGEVQSPKWQRPGLVFDLVFPQAEKLLPPADVAADVDIARRMLAEFESWNWADGPVSAYLLLCWSVAAMVGGALPHRPHIWIYGASGAGKTTLQKFLRRLMGDWAVKTEDATEAGVRQLLDSDTLPVMFDEIEPDEDNPQVHLKIVKLARLAYSGGEALRGGQDHKSKSFSAKSCFMFSSILHHQLPEQDRNRMAVLGLLPIPDQVARRAHIPGVEAWGLRIRRRIVERWHLFEPVLQTFQAAMLANGYVGREQDTYGTLLACGHLVLQDGIIEGDAGAAYVQAQIEHLASIIGTARSESEDTTERCLGRLLSTRLPAAPGQAPESVARWVSRAMVEVVNQTTANNPPALKKLETHGLKLTMAPMGDGSPGRSAGTVATCYGVLPVWLCVAGKMHRGTAELFDGSTWANGVWSQALARIPGAEAGARTKIDGATYAVTMLPIERLIDMQAVRDTAADVMAV